MKLVKVYPSIRRQRIIGFGGALTEASAFVFAQMSEAAREHFLELYFGASGNRYGFCRTVIQSSDFSLAPRAYLDNPKDTKLAGFSLADDYRYEIPLIKAALSKNPSMRFLASPWSPPAWAKTNRNMKLGGRLKRSKYGIWAKMIARYILEYRREGIDIGWVTVQNEPQARQTWESCLFKADQEFKFACEYLRPALDDAGLEDVRILMWDHNKDGVLDRVSACMTADDKRVIGGAAFHWYTGDHFEALAHARELLGPNRDLVFSEGCDAYSAGDTAQELPHAEHYAHEIVGDLKNGANGILDWNVLLDTDGGPNHVGNYCDAPMMYDIAQDKLHVRLPYYYLGHFSRYIPSEARNVLVSAYTDRLQTCAFVTDEDSIVVIVLNCTDSDIEFELRIEEASILPNKTYPVVSPRHSIMTIVRD